MSEPTRNTETTNAASSPAAAPAGAGASAVAPAAGLAPSAALTCTFCGGENSLDSQYCRHCGKPLAPAAAASNGSNGTAHTPPPPAPAAAPATGPATASGAVAASGATAASVADALPGESDGPDLTPQEIDLRRSRQLLDRALSLSEQGDRASAMLACRQAIALAPAAPAGYSMLGLLLERNGDIEHAIAAYQKVLELAPNSPLERDSLHRLRAAMNQNKTAPVFHFNSTELFDPEAESEQPASAPSVEEPAPTDPAQAGASQTGLAPAAAAGAVASGPPLAGPDAPAGAGAAPRPAVVPSQIGAAAAMTVPSIPPLASIQDDYLDEPRDTRSGLLRTLRHHNSFYVQATPLMAVAVLALGFLLWARGIAVDRARPGGANPVSPAPATSGPVRVGDATSANGQPAATAGGQPVPAPSPPPDGAPVSITNGAQPTPAATPVAPAAGQARPAAPRSGEQPRFPAVPSARPADSERTAREEGNEVLTGLRPFPIARPAPEAAPTPVPVLPAASGSSEPTGRSSSGTPVSSGGAGPRGYVRVTGSRPPVGAAPARPENRSRAAEEAAREEAASGRTERAIERTTSAIDSGRGGDTGWRYQQRALLHLENGNNSQAIDDFQTAIAAYRDQIARNVRPAEARSGIAACQSGLRLAQSRVR